MALRSNSLKRKDSERKFYENAEGFFCNDFGLFKVPHTGILHIRFDGGEYKAESFPAAPLHSTLLPSDWYIPSPSLQTFILLLGDKSRIGATGDYSRNRRLTRAPLAILLYASALFPIRATSLHVP